MKILYFTDAHDTPDTDQRRFTKLGNLVVEEEPDHIVQGGDFLTLDSLSGWDAHKARLKERQRYRDELDSACEAISLLTKPLQLKQEQQRRDKKRIYKPSVYWLDGNHEQWVEGYLDRFPETEGLLELDRFITLPDSLFSSVVKVPYKDTVGVGGIAFTHAVIGRTGPISSVYLCRRALAEVHCSSVVFGHTHTFQIHETEKIHWDGSKRKHVALNGGCFFEETPRYSRGNTNNYWRGVFLIHTNDDDPKQPFDIEAISMRRLLSEY